MKTHLYVQGIAAALATLAMGYSAQSLAAQDAVTGHSTYVDTSGQVVHCISTESGRTYCGKPHMRYTISGTPAPACVEGSTWGFDDRGVWVSGGCTANFTAASDDTVVSKSTTVNSDGTTVHCLATASGRTYCGKPHQRYVIVGNAPATCVEGSTWGIDDRGVWVLKGCTADFRIESN